MPTAISLPKLKSFTNKNCEELIVEIGKIVDMNLHASCSVKSVAHYNEIKAVFENKMARVRIEQKELPGSTLTYKKEPVELASFSYQQLKDAAQEENKIYKGILYGTVKQHSCAQKVDCPECVGTGICPNCKGEKQIICPVCDGNMECISCGATGKYTCEHCEGDGECPECSNGTHYCNECQGRGRVYCPDCNGSGNYIDEECDRCGGTGEYKWGKTCPVCDGSGRFIRECRRCNGTGEIECDECDGDGYVDCEECNGTGECSHCHGRGWHKCKACDGSGKCGKCNGRGKIWCPNCHGKGICFNCKGEKLVICPRCNGSGKYQSYTEYTLEEIEKDRILCSFPVEKKDFSLIEGDICYDDVLYDFFAQKGNIINSDKVKSIVGSINNARLDIIKKWIELKNNSTFCCNEVNDDYLHSDIKLYKVPITKVVLSCRSKDYSIWVVGSNRIVYYDALPSLWNRGLSRLFG